MTAAVSRSDYVTRNGKNAWQPLKPSDIFKTLVCTERQNGIYYESMLTGRHIVLLGLIVKWPQQVFYIYGDNGIKRIYVQNT